MAPLRDLGAAPRPRRILSARARSILPALLLSCSSLWSGCHSGGSARAPIVESPETCAARLSGFQGFVSALPEQAIVSSLHVDLPESTLGALPGRGPVIEIASDRVLLDGQRVEATSGPERVQRVEAWLREHADAAQPRGASPGPATGQAAGGAPGKAEAGARTVVYVAAARDVDIQTLRAYLAHTPETIELRLLLHTSLDGAAAESTEPSEARAIAARILAEREPPKRQELADAAYRKFASCSALAQAVSTADGLPPDQRWPRLRSAVLGALPSCRCTELDTESLRSVLVAEERAGAFGLGWLPLSFIRDERCGATMPLRSVAKLVKQIEDFDSEFAGKFENETLEFGNVLATPRLVEYFCGALPGETLAAEQRARATLYFRPAGSDDCEAWRFEPLSTGAPMGTWRRVAKGPGLAFHYFQAAEEIRVFGPAGPETKPTDEREWACEQKLRLTHVDARSIELEMGRLFFDEATCRAAPTGGGKPSGCFFALAAGAPEPSESPVTTRRPAPSK